MFRKVLDEHGNLCGMERYYAACEVLEEPFEINPDYSILCDGRAVSRAEYAELFAVIGTAYGDGDGKETFNVPDWRGLAQRRFVPPDVIVPKMKLYITYHSHTE